MQKILKTSKVQKIKLKLDELDYIKINVVCLVKNIKDKINRLTEWKSYLQCLKQWSTNI